jgi:hypothetical protein
MRDRGGDDEGEAAIPPNAHQVNRRPLRASEQFRHGRRIWWCGTFSQGYTPLPCVQLCSQRPHSPFWPRKPADWETLLTLINLRGSNADHKMFCDFSPSREFIPLADHIFTLWDLNLARVPMPDEGVEDQSAHFRADLRFQFCFCGCIMIASYAQARVVFSDFCRSAFFSLETVLGGPHRLR